MIDWYRSYCGDAPLPDDWATRWNGDPLLLALLCLALLPVLRLPAGRRLAGIGAVAGLAMAFVSPLCALTTALFAARAVHHLLLFAVVAPLLVIAFPVRRPVPVVVALPLSTLVLWAWHVRPGMSGSIGRCRAHWSPAAGATGRRSGALRLPRASPGSSGSRADGIPRRGPDLVRRARAMRRTARRHGRSASGRLPISRSRAS